MVTGAQRIVMWQGSQSSVSYYLKWTRMIGAQDEQDLGRTTGGTRVLPPTAPQLAAFTQSKWPQITQ